jgi:hypothetical protein
LSQFEPIYVHRQSRTLSQILVELRASNNYIANQIFLEIGAHRRGGPVIGEMELRGQFASQQSVRPNARYGSAWTGPYPNPRWAVRRLLTAF